MNVRNWLCKFNAFLMIIAAMLLLSSCGGGGDPEPSPEPNKPPNVAINGPSQFDEQIASVLSALAHDSDGHIVKYQWKLVSGDKVTFSGENTSRLTLVSADLDQDTQITVSLTVTDDDGASATSEHTVKIIATQAVSELTLNGQVTDKPIANASIKITVGSDAFTGQADAQGAYSILLQVTEKNINKLVLIEASGDPSMQAEVKLVSLLASFSTLKSQAGDDQTLNVDENFSVNVTNVSTAEYQLIVEANNGELPATQAELSEALDKVDVEKKLKIASLLKIIIDEDGYEIPPEKTDTLALIADPVAIDNFEAFVVSQDANLINQMLQIIIEDPMLVNIGGEGQDYDKDGVPDALDAFPADPNESVDTDM
ncbi:PKD domain-containing protein, partial [Gayadomonas joobiniege]|uniref:PKD domain-containing protein n=1 Tax=Gayadomonas joobiniege TaxID=1234606 RepID=UPI00058B7AAD